MYNALILPYFDYSSCVWGYIGIGLTEKLQQLQNRAARIVTLSNYETRSKDLLDDLGLGSTGIDRRMRKLAILMYKITHDISPPCLRNIFENVSDVHSYDLRNSSISLYVPNIAFITEDRSFGLKSLWRRGNRKAY